MDFSKASNTLNQKAFFAKLEAYDLDSEFSCFLQSYLGDWDKVT